MASVPRVLAGQTVAITGAARGIGRATAQALVARGARVAVGDLDLVTAQAAAAELGDGALALPVDVTDRGSFAAFLDATAAQLAPVDVLINNAGIMQLGRFDEEDDITARRMFDINVHGVILGTKLALERMIPRGRGHIVNIASQAGKIGFPGGATYSATKHAVIGLTEAVRGEMRLAGLPIELSYVMPAIVDTELGSGLGHTRGVKKLAPQDVAEAIVEALEQGTVDVWVPKATKPLNILATVTPRRVGEGIARVIKADRALYAADTGTRRDYELRAARSEPALKGAEAPRALESAAEAPVLVEQTEEV